jgi:hypothetical protein
LVEVIALADNGRTIALVQQPQEGVHEHARVAIDESGRARPVQPAS